MQNIGQVVALLNENLLLFSSTIESLKVNEILDVAAVIQHPQLKEDLQLEQLLVPVGRIKVISKQEGGYYLAERFQEILHRKRKEVVAPRDSIASMIAATQPTTYDVIDEVPGPWSARLSEDQRLGVSVPSAISVGDRVQRTR